MLAEREATLLIDAMRICGVRHIGSSCSPKLDVKTLGFTQKSQNVSTSWIPSALSSEPAAPPVALQHPQWLRLLSLQQHPQ